MQYLDQCQFLNIFRPVAHCTGDCLPLLRSDENMYRWSSTSGHQITINVCSYYSSTAVISREKFCSVVRIRTASNVAKYDTSLNMVSELLKYLTNIKSFERMKWLICTLIFDGFGNGLSRISVNSLSEPIQICHYHDLNVCPPWNTLPSFIEWIAHPPMMSQDDGCLLFIILILNLIHLVARFEPQVNVWRIYFRNSLSLKSPHKASNAEF